MGDRTFSDLDVIRIYEDFLTNAEQERVELFFEGLQEPAVPPVTFDDVRILQEINRATQVPLPGLFSTILQNIPFVLTLIDTVLFNVERSRIIINEILSREDVSA